MATLCRNCGAPLIFDPSTQRVQCQACGSSWMPEEIESAAKAFSSDNVAEPVAPGGSSAVKEFMDCYIYTCSSCGGEIVINGSETSTTCIYCGSSSVVFSRIDKEKRPDFIIPFQISKEDATKIIHDRFMQGLFIPKEFKNLQPESVRGIYIPYWLVDVYHAESNVIRGEVGSGDNSTTYYYGRSGILQMKSMPVESSQLLNDESSKQLEPYSYAKLKPFDEEYLLGFYSNRSDTNYGQMRQVVDKEATNCFQTCARQDIRATSKHVIKESHSTLIDKNMVYALFPAWFVTVTYEGKHHTILVNGESGKIVCGLPWNQKFFWSLVFTIGGAVGLVHGLVGLLISLLMNREGDMRLLFLIFGTGFFSPVMVFVVALICVLIGLFKFKQVTNQIKLTQDNDIFTFTQRRQG